MKGYATPLTVADLAAAPEDGNRYELIDGELHVSTAPRIFHQQILVRLIVALNDYLRVHPIGEVLPGIGIVYDQFNGVIPDLIFVTHERRDRITANHRLTASPEIVIEILSPGAENELRDRKLKRDLYSKRAVHEYWLVDPESKTIDVHRFRREGGLEFIGTLDSAQDLTSAELPGFHMAVADLFGR